MAKILGIDLGTNSIGWAITEQKEDGNYRLLDKGVNIFQEGVNRVKGNEEPSVKKRTESRASRRHYFRRRLRKIELLKVLIENKMCPLLTNEQLADWRYKKNYPMDDAFILWQRTDDNKDKNPYHDRYTALSQKLDLSIQPNRYLLGRAFYHLAQRRGFLSNRKDQSDAKESGQVKESRSLSGLMKEAGCQYLGEYQYQLYKSGEKIRRQTTSRKEHYEREFYAICAKQQLPDALTTALYRAIFYQRPLKSQKGTVGKCTFERSKSRCPISHPRFEEFRMLSFLNNVKIKAPADDHFRILTAEERRSAEQLFMRKSKPQFDFEDIAKNLSGGKKNTHSYQFNFKMSTSVSGCPVTAALRDIFGDDWLNEICSLYLKGAGKSEEQILNDVWHALFSFDSDDKLREWGKTNLQLENEQADKFVKISIKQGYAALSLNAINKILPYLRAGFRYGEAVFLANLSAVVPAEIWEDTEQRGKIEEEVCNILEDYTQNPTNKDKTEKNCIADMLLDNYGIDRNCSKYLYHPSQVDTYQDVKPNADGFYQLAPLRTSSVRNPMAMRALFRLRSLVNYLLRERRIDRHTKINVEFARGLNDANMRAAIEQYNNTQAKNHRKYIDSIKELYREETGRDIEPTEEDILKYQLWEEQNHICLYTGKTISITDFIGGNPAYDIEHTVPRSRGGDNSQMNKTLCQCRFNREEKRAFLPSELANHEEIMARVEALGWATKIEDLDKRIQAKIAASRGAATKEMKDKSIKEKHVLKMERNYWAGKLQRFTMSEVPEGFSNRQGVDIGIIGRYARMYLNTVFEQVYTIKGATTADFRKMWGLQEEYEKKERINHVHHCIDAITIACIGKGAYGKWAAYQTATEYYDLHLGEKPQIEKPWPTFTEDVKSVAETLLVSHHTPDNMPKQSKKRMRIRGKVQKNNDGQTKYVQGDTARGSLHKETYYGAIKHQEEIKYVVRKPLDSLEASDVKNIVDDAVRKCVEEALAKDRNALSRPICFNAEKGVYIKKVRVFTPSVTQPIKLKKHRDLSPMEYKQHYHVENDGNYCMAIYEGTDGKGKVKRSFELLNNLKAATYFNSKTNGESLVSLSDKDGYPLKCILKTGTMVLFYEKSPEELYECSAAELSKRLYKVTGMSISTRQKKYLYGMIVLKHHQEARQNTYLSLKKGIWKKGEMYRPRIEMSHIQLKAYIEGYDFELTVAGEIKFKH